MYYCSWECRNTTVWVLNRDRKFKVGIASRETIRFLTLRQLMVSKIQRSWRQMRDFTVICNFQAGIETTKCRARFSFRRRLTPNSLFASKLPRKVWGEAPKLTLPPGVGSLGAPLSVCRCFVYPLRNHWRTVSETHSRPGKKQNGSYTWMWQLTSHDRTQTKS